MRRGHFAHLTCACGRDTVMMMADLPRADRDATGWVMTDAALARLVCRACGSRGRPPEVRFGWSAGMPDRPSAPRAANRSAGIPRDTLE